MLRCRRYLPPLIINIKPTKIPLGILHLFFFDAFYVLISNHFQDVSIVDFGFSGSVIVVAVAISGTIVIVVDIRLWQRSRISAQW